MSNVFSWCCTHGRPDHFHDACPREYVTQVGVTVTCGCPNHEPTEATD